MQTRMEKPLYRSKLRASLGQCYYSLRRKMLWARMESCFAKEHREGRLPYVYVSHETPLLRQLKDVEMQWQRNKVGNLKIAVKHIDGILLKPGETLSYWRLIGKPTRRKGYQEGMVLHHGQVGAGVGGGLCQLSNLIFWMTLHTPLTVTERHRHGYDVFPDANRTQPFGSGATCFYPHGDLMIRNDTNQTFQLSLQVGAENLEGQWLGEFPKSIAYRVVERNHEMRSQFWGGYSRHNQLFREAYDLEGNPIGEEWVAENNAIMMYAPFIEEEKDC